MSPFFIENFKKLKKCPKCDNLTSRSLCDKHLDEAASRWMIWSLFRKTEGLCSYCDNKSYNGWVRCRKHTLYNRQKCSKWQKKFGKARYLARKESGVCVSSPKHGRVKAPHVYCDNCLEK